MRILVVGAGSIGRRHIRNLNELGYTSIDVCDIDKSRIAYSNKFFDIENIYDDYHTALNKNEYDVGFVLTHPSSHLSIAYELADHGMDMFIEKPLSDTLDFIEGFKNKTEEENLIVQVGYQFRYDTGVLSMRKIISDGILGDLLYISAHVGSCLESWRPLQDYKKNYSSKREMGGGALLDHSHEFDYVNWLANSKVIECKSSFGKLSRLDINVEDYADILLEYENGIRGLIHLDIIDRLPIRTCRLLGTEGTCFFDFTSRHLKVKNIKNKNQISVSPSWELAYIEEIKDFMKCVKDRITPLNSINNSIDILNLIESLKNVV